VILKKLKKKLYLIVHRDEKVLQKLKEKNKDIKKKSKELFIVVKENIGIKE